MSSGYADSATRSFLNFADRADPDSWHWKCRGARATLVEMVRERIPRGRGHRVCTVKSISSFVTSLLVLLSACSIGPDRPFSDGERSATLSGIVYAGPVLRSHSYHGLRGGFDFQSFQLRAVKGPGQPVRHELYAELAYSGERRTYRRATANGMALDGLVQIGEEAVGCPQYRPGPACDHRLMLAVPLSGRLLREHRTNGLAVRLAAVTDRTNIFEIPPNYIRTYLETVSSLGVTR